MKITATLANGQRKAYEVGELDLGEFRTLKRLFDVKRMDLLDPRDPDHLVGYLTIAELRQSPGRELEQVVREFEAVSKIEVEAEDEDEQDPTRAASSQSSSESQPSASTPEGASPAVGADGGARAAGSADPAGSS